MKRLALLLPLLVAVASCDNVPSWAGGKKKETERLSGERVAVLRRATELQSDPTLVQMPMELPPPRANAAWPQHGGSATASMRHVALPASLSSRESATIGEGEDFGYRLVIVPVVADGLVFAMDAYGYLSAHDAKDVGAKRWASPGLVTEDEEPILGGGLAYDKGHLYATSGKGEVAMFDAANGTEIWRQTLNIPIRSAPRVDAGTVYAVTVDSQLYALDARTGAVLWSHRGISEGAGFLIQATPAATPERVVAPYASGEIHVLHADDGTAIWGDAVMGPQRQSATAVFGGIGGDPVIADDVLYVAGSAGMFAAFHLETGRRLWEQPISSTQTPWVAGDYVFVLTSDSALLALHRRDGRVRWQHQLPAFADEEAKSEHYMWSGPVLAGGRLLVAGAHGVMLELSPESGGLLAETSIPSGVHAAPVVAGERAYLITDGAALHALY